ncbi:unnamed protein product [Amaranthus hypochondriacus]
MTDRSWLVNFRGIAKKIKHATSPSVVKIKDCGAKLECPNCHTLIDNSDISCEWPGLPAGVKFDPSDAELLEHLAAKCGVEETNPHDFIDEFIPTLVRDKGICYTHPKDLPGATKDGTRIHFFHKTSNAYASGQRKRRKIQNDENQENVRWHKTGKTKPIFDNGIQKGCKKIMVLYTASQKGSKPVKSNWVMHQYHLGTEDDEKEDEFVVSKIYYQKEKHREGNDNSIAIVAEDQKAVSIPNTPNTVTPNPPRESSVKYDDVLDDSVAVVEDVKNENATLGYPATSSQYKGGDVECPECPAGESQAQDVDLNDIENSLLCREIFSSCAPLDNSIVGCLNDLHDEAYNGSYDVSILDTIHLDSPPDFPLTDLQLGSKDSIHHWLDRL